MPMNLNIGWQKKVGQPDYGSLGASCHLEVEIEASLIREPDELRRKIRFLFDEAKQAVEEELTVQRDAVNNGNGHDGKGSHRPTNGRSATSAQIRALHAIASRNQIDLSARLTQDFGIVRPEDLSITDASTLIDAMKSNGTGARR